MSAVSFSTETLRRIGSVSDLEDGVDIYFIPPASRESIRELNQPCKFYYGKAVVCPSDAGVISKLNKVKSSLEDKGRQVAKISGAIRERKIETTTGEPFKDVGRELRDLLTSFEGQVVESKDASDSIPSMKSHEKLAGAFCRRMNIGMTCSFFQRTADDINNNIESDLYTTAIQFFKDKIAAIATIRQCPTSERKLIELTTLFNTTKDQIALFEKQQQNKSKRVVQTVNAIYKDLLSLFHALAVRMQKEVKGDKEKADVLRRFEFLKKDLTASIAALTPPSSETPLNAVVPKAFLDEFLKPAALLDLPKEDKFQAGALFAPISYPKIYPHMQELETLARGLHMLDGKLNARIEAIMNGKALPIGSYEKDLQVYKGLLEGMVCRIREKHAKLVAGDYSEQLDAGTGYASKVLIKAEAVEEKLRRFIQLTKGSLYPYAAATRDLAGYLSAKDLTGADAITNLYHAICSASELKKPKASLEKKSFTKQFCDQAYTMIYDIIGNVGPRTVAKSPEVPEQIFGLRPIKSGPAGTDDFAKLIDYLKKSYLAIEHFSKEETDPELETLLYILEHHPIYREAFEKISQHTFLIILASAYKRQSDMQNHSETLQIMAEIVTTLHRTGFEEETVAFQRYFKMKCCLNRLSTMKAGKLSTHEQARIRWIKESAAAKLAAFETAKKIPAELKQMDLEMLLAALYLDDQKAQAEVMSNFRADISQPWMAHGDTVKNILKPLYVRVLLLDFIKNPTDPRSSDEMNHLFDLFRDYLSDDDLRDFYRQEHGFIAMEYALSSFAASSTHSKRDSIKEEIERQRGTIYFDMWQEISQLAYTLRHDQAQFRQACEPIFEKNLEGLDESYDPSSEDLLGLAHRLFAAIN